MNTVRSAWLLLALTLLGWLALLPVREPLFRVWGDEGTFLAMSESLAHDFDLRFDERDMERLERTEGGRATVILQRAEEGVFYSKPIVYSLLAAPFHALFGERGPVILNALSLTLALLLTHAYLLRFGSPSRAAWVLSTFVGAGVVVPYVFWRMSDMLQLSLCLAGLVLCLADRPGAQERREGAWQRLLSWRGAPYLGALLLGLLVTMRLSNAALAAIPVLAALFRGRPGRGSRLALASAVSVLGVMLLGLALAGSGNPYRAVRSSFNAKTGYPVGDAEEVRQRFDQQPATHVTGLRPISGLERSAFSTLFFFIGRHTGILVYFPAALILLLCALWRPDRTSFAALLGFAATQGFFLGWMSWNYFGGDTFLGNRYLLSAYPALLLAQSRLPSRRSLGVAWMLALLAYSSAWFSETRAAEGLRHSQTHAYAGIFRYLPYESTAQGLEGREDRYWSGFFVRFVDPFARVREGHFELRAGASPAEIVVADWRSEEPLRFWVETEAPRAVLHVEDYRREWSFEVGSAAGPRPVRFELQPSAPWRWHHFWWEPVKVYDVKTFRLRLKTPDGSPATARVRLVEEAGAYEGAFSYQLLSSEVPAEVPASTAPPVRLRLRNTSSRAWEGHGVVPVYAKVRIFSATAEGPGEMLSESRALPFSGVIAPGEELDLPLTVEWPARPGRYLLQVDLVLSQVAWFQDRVGAPVLERAFTVLEAPRTPRSTRVSP